MSDITVKVPTVYVEGGILQGMQGFEPGFRIDVIDYDIESVDENRLCKCEAGDSEHSHSEITINEKGQY